MPVTIHSSALKVKDMNTGQYVGVDGVSESTAAEKVAQINAAGAANLADINTRAQEVEASLPKSGEMEDMVAEVFVKSNPYPAGQILIQAVNNVNKLYQLKGPHTAGDDWDASNATEIKLGDEVSSLESALRTQGIKYGRCTTAGNTEAKTVTIEGITALVAGMTVVIKFAYKNTVWSPTLNINNLGAKHIYPYGYTPPPPYPVDPSYPSMIGAWENESAVLLSYDGYAFTMCGWTPREYYSGYYNETLGSGTYPIAGIACTGYVLRDNSYLFVNFPTAAPKDMSANPKVTINVNGTGDKELKLNGETAINGVPAGTYLMFYDGTDFHVRNDGRIPGAVYIDDTAGDGDTTKVWSADKLVDQFALKLDNSNIATVAQTQAMIDDFYGAVST